MKALTYAVGVLLLVPTGKLKGLDKRFSVALVDRSEEASPLRGSGEASFYVNDSEDTIKEECALDGLLRNVSAKDILAFDASVDLFPGLGGGTRLQYHIDYIFDNKLLKPGSSFPIHSSPSRSEFPRNQATPSERAKAEVRVTFVQFADGSTFGRGEWGESIWTERNAEIDRMNALMRAYDGGGAGAFSTALIEMLTEARNSQGVRDRLNQIKDVRDRQGAEVAAAEVRRYLSNAMPRMKIDQTRPRRS